MFAGWRMKYVKDADRARGCLFCRFRARGDDAKRLVLTRRRAAYLMLNAYPYNTGHLMVAVGRHVGELGGLSAAERRDFWDLAALGETLLQEVYHPEGLNAGINLGRCAGAGVDGHLHMHLVPRWFGDTNFMTTTGDTKVLPEDLDETYRRLSEALAQRSGRRRVAGRARRSR